jgi:hypothetical protein
VIAGSKQSKDSSKMIKLSFMRDIPVPRRSRNCMSAWSRYTFRLSIWQMRLKRGS